MNAGSPDCVLLSRKIATIWTFLFGMPDFQLIKFNPLLHWSLEDCQKYVKENNVPYNVLHDRGFVSIGCAPCTRAIQPGEDFRAGRWWWEDNSKKECGLHTHQE